MVRKYEATTVRRKQILDSARQVITKHGSEHLTVNNIAKEVGISETAIYRHYKSKRDILSFLVDNIGITLLEGVSKEGAKGNTSLEVLDNVLKNHMSGIEQRHGISFKVIAEIISLGNDDLDKKVSSAIDTYIENIKELIKDGVDSGEISEDIDVEATAIIIFSIVQGIVSIWAIKNYDFDPLQKYLSVWSVFRKALVNSKKNEYIINCSVPDKEV